MQKEDRKERLSLTLLIAVLVFVIQLFSLLAAIGIIVILMRTGIIKELSEDLLSPRNALFLMSVISLLVGGIVVAFSGKLYLRPVNRLINHASVKMSASAFSKRAFSARKRRTRPPAMTASNDSFISYCLQERTPPS